MRAPPLPSSVGATGRSPLPVVLQPHRQSATPSPIRNPIANPQPHRQSATPSVIPATPPVIPAQAGIHRNPPLTLTPLHLPLTLSLSKGRAERASPSSPSPILGEGRGEGASLALLCRGDRPVAPTRRSATPSPIRNPLRHSRNPTRHSRESGNPSQPSAHPVAPTPPAHPEPVEGLVEGYLIPSPFNHLRHSRESGNLGEGPERG